MVAHTWWGYAVSNETWLVPCLAQVVQKFQSWGKLLKQMLCVVLLVVNGFWFTTCTIEIMVCNQATPQSLRSLPISQISLHSCRWHWWGFLVVPEPTSHLFLDGSQPALPEVSVQQLQIVDWQNSQTHPTTMVQLMVLCGSQLQLFYNNITGNLMWWHGLALNVYWLLNEYAA